MKLMQELKRRNVFRVAIAYLVVAWLLAQVSTTLEAALNLPPWFDTLVVSLLLIGFPIALFFAWVFELTPEGIKREKNINRSDSTTQITAKKLDYVTIVAALAVLGMFVWQQFDDNNSELKSDALDSVTTKSAVDKPVDPAVDVVNNQSIAVLPFTNMTNNPDSEAITVGLHDDLLTHISKISALKVISRTSVLRFKDTQLSITEIAETLGVAHILEGGVQRSGNQIRINVQLIDAQTDEHLWAELYDRELTANNIFNIQTEISKKIATALKAQLSSEEQQSLAKQDTDNLEAYSVYLAGRQLILNRNSEDLKQALKLFEKASELDPNYAQAYVGQALTWNLLHEYSDVTFQERSERGEPLVDMALMINPMLAIAHAVKGTYLQRKQLFLDAEKSYQYAIKLNPNESSAYHWYGMMLRNNLSRPEESLIQINKAAELDPFSPSIQANVGWSLLALDRVEEALQHFEFLNDFSPGYHGGSQGLSVINRIRGQYDLAIKWIKEAINRNKGFVSNYESLAYLYLNLQALSEAKQVVDNIQSRFPNSANGIRSLIFIALYEGQLDHAIELTQQLLTIDGDNPVTQHYKWSIAFFARHYQTTHDILLPQLMNDTEQWVEVEANNVHQFIVLSWCLKQLSQAEQAQNIIEHLRPHQKLLVDSDILYQAIQGNQQQTADIFAGYVDKKEIDFWWVLLKFPMLDEIKKMPVFIKAHKQLMHELKQQRENLAELDSAGQSE